MNIEIFDGEWTVEDVKKNSDKVFVYGDNNLRMGKVGQAIIRDLPNTLGLRTKKGPSNKLAAFYTDNEFEQNTNHIREDILKIKSILLDGKTVVFSSGGYGTGLAKLSNTAPKTFDFLNQLLKNYFNFDNNKGKRWIKIPGHDELISGEYISLDKENPLIIQPVNNSFFRSDLLDKNLNTLTDLIKSEKKTSFLSGRHFDSNKILILTSKLSPLYIVCRVVDCYDINQFERDLIYKFEGFNNDFKFTFKEISIYQTQIEFISTLDQNGNMLYKEGLFSDTIPKKKSNKTVGEKIIQEETVKNDEMLQLLKDLQQRLDKIENKKLFKNPFRKSLQKLLEEKKIFGQIQRITDDFEDSNYERYQIKTSNDDFYLVRLHRGFLFNSLEIIHTSKTSFI